MLATTMPALPILHQDFTIEAGKRVGKLYLGAERRMVLKQLGKPRKQVVINEKLKNDYWESKKSETIDVYYLNDKVIQISISSPSFKIADQINTNSSLAEIKEMFKELKKQRYYVELKDKKSSDISDDEETAERLYFTYFDDIDQGVAFVFVYDKPTQAIDESLPSNIIIHYPGEPLYHEDGEHTLDEVKENDA
jgi:hypothetical protein